MVSGNRGSLQRGEPAPAQCRDKPLKDQPPLGTANLLLLSAATVLPGDLHLLPPVALLGIVFADRFAGRALLAAFALLNRGYELVAEASQRLQLSRYSPEDLAKAGVQPGMIRLSCGVECHPLTCRYTESATVR